MHPVTLCLWTLALLAVLFALAAVLATAWWLPASAACLLGLLALAGYVTAGESK